MSAQAGPWRTVSHGEELGATFHVLARIAGHGSGPDLQNLIEAGGRVLDTGAWLTIAFSAAILVTILAPAPGEGHPAAPPSA